jgi:hypothetical protein
VKTLLTWTGYDGTVWDLTDTAGGIIATQGIEGFHHPKFKQWTRQSPAVPGQLFTGAIAEARNIVLPLLIWSDGTSAEWVARDRAFWKSMHPVREGTLTVSPAGSGSKRSIKCRMVPEDHGYEVDPAEARWADYTVLLVADQPFWLGKTFEAGWNTASGQDFYEVNGPHLININSGHTTANASVLNDGDEDAWPIWKVIGPSTAAHMGIGDKVVEIPFTVADGKALVLDTDPRVQTAIEYDYAAGVLSNPVDRTTDLVGAVDFAPVPANTTSPLNISITGNGMIRIELTPLYWRAW